MTVAWAVGSASKKADEAAMMTEGGVCGSEFGCCQ